MNIAATPDALLARVEWFANRLEAGYVFKVNGRSFDPTDLRALVALTRPSPQASDAWTCCFYGSPPDKGVTIWTIRNNEKRRAIAYLGEGKADEARAIVAEHNAAIAAMQPAQGGEVDRWGEEMQHQEGYCHD